MKNIDEIKHLDEDGYPTDEALKYIETFDWKEGDVNELFAFIKSIWNMYVWTESDVEDGRFNKINKYRRYEFSTGGWSGNEEIIRAFQRNNFEQSLKKFLVSFDLFS